MQRMLSEVWFLTNMANFVGRMHLIPEPLVGKGLKNISNVTYQL